MDRPEIEIRDTRHHGDDLPVAEATARPGPSDPAAGHLPAAPARAYERGDRVALEHTGDPHTRLRPGDEGTVTRYAPGLAQLSIAWDSGSTLSMLLDEGDRVRLLSPGTGEAGTEPAR
jgi:Domain of unknown function (DUF4314)